LGGGTITNSKNKQKEINFTNKINKILASINTRRISITFFLLPILTLLFVQSVSLIINIIENIYNEDSSFLLYDMILFISPFWTFSLIILFLHLTSKFDKKDKPWEYITLIIFSFILIVITVFTIIICDNPFNRFYLIALIIIFAVISLCTACVLERIFKRIYKIIIHSYQNDRDVDKFTFEDKVIAIVIFSVSALTFFSTLLTLMIGLSDLL